MANVTYPILSEGMVKSPYFDPGRHWKNGHRQDLEYIHDASKIRSWYTHNHARSATVSRIQKTAICPFVVIFGTGSGVIYNNMPCDLGIIKN